MQCPNCGFQNMPGITECGLCSSPLSTGPARVSVLPPRARERTLRDRVHWTMERLHLRREPEAETDRAPSSSRRITMRDMLVLAASVIPGAGPMLVRPAEKSSRWQAAAVAACLLLAALLYRHWLSNVFLWGLAGLSVSSVVIAIEAVRPWPPAADWLHAQRRLGLALAVIATYALTYLSANLLLADHLYTAIVRQEVPAMGAAPGDSLLFVRMDSPRRGDIVTGRLGRRLEQGTNSIGPILGLPGDTLTLSTWLSVNGRPNPVLVEGMPGEPATLRLGPDEYWVPPVFRGGGATNDLILQSGVMNRRDIHGRAVAILGRPAHRALIHRQPNPE